MLLHLRKLELLRKLLFEMPLVLIAGQNLVEPAPES
jgi:hypothetical protein